jgi:hypothetical protein
MIDSDKKPNIPVAFWNGCFENVTTLSFQGALLALEGLRLGEHPFPSLRSLNIHTTCGSTHYHKPDSFLFDQHFFPIIQRNAAQLEELSVILCPLTYMYKPLPYFPVLKRLDIRGCFEKVDESNNARELVRAHFRGLQEFAFAASWNGVALGDALEAGMQAPHLTSLKLGGRFAIIEPFTTFLQEHMPQLQTLWLSNANYQWQLDNETALFKITQDNTLGNGVRDLLLQVKELNRDLMKKLQSAFPRVHTLRLYVSGSRPEKKTVRLNKIIQLSTSNRWADQGCSTRTTPIKRKEGLVRAAPPGESA